MFCLNILKFLKTQTIKQILLKIGVISKPKYDHFIEKEVEILSGPYQGLKGVVSGVDNDQAKLVVEIDLFGSEISLPQIFLKTLKESSLLFFSEKLSATRA